MDAVVDGKPVLIPLHLNHGKTSNKINKIASIYGKDEAGKWLAEQVGKGNVLYYGKTRAEAMHWHVSGLQLPRSLQSLDSNKKILTEGDIVKPVMPGGTLYQSAREASTLELDTDAAFLIPSEALDTPDKVALHNAKVEIAETLWSEQNLDSNVVYALKGDTLEDRTPTWWRNTWSAWETCARFRRTLKNTTTMSLRLKTPKCLNRPRTCLSGPRPPDDGNQTGSNSPRRP